MDIESANRYTVARKIASDTHVGPGLIAVAMSVIDEAMTNHHPVINLSSEEGQELEEDPHIRFERLWSQGMSLLEAKNGEWGEIEGHGYTASNLGLIVKLTFRHDITHEGPFGVNDRIIEAQWLEMKDEKYLGPREVIREEETRLDPMSSETLGEDPFERMLLVEESLIACQTFRSQQTGVFQPSPILY